jgi:hypothetical protein
VFKLANIGSKCVFAVLLFLVVQINVQAQLRDPTMPYGYSPTAVENLDTGQPEITLAGIISGPHGMSAVINGKRVRKGDIIHGRKVIAVKTDHVVLGMGAQQERIFLRAMKFKKTSPKQSGGDNE